MFGGAHMFWMVISWLFLIGIFAMLPWFVAKAMGSRPESSGGAEEILRRRYAAGEIDTNEYERRLEELRTTKSAA